MKFVVDSESRARNDGLKPLESLIQTRIRASGFFHRFRTGSLVAVVILFFLEVSERPARSLFHEKSRADVDDDQPGDKGDLESDSRESDRPGMPIEILGNSATDAKTDSIFSASVKVKFSISSSMSSISSVMHRCVPLLFLVIERLLVRKSLCLELLFHFSFSLKEYRF